MIELFSANTPNGWKISIMLEEIGYEYKVTPVDLGKEEQFKPEYLKIFISSFSNNFRKKNWVDIKKIKGNISKIIDGEFINDK